MEISYKTYDDLKRDYEVKNNILPLKIIDNPDTINIFTDGSHKAGKWSSYGALVVQDNQIINTDFRYADPNESNNIMELKGIRIAVGLAYYYAQFVPFINIFSDNTYAIDSIYRAAGRWVWSRELQRYTIARYEKDKVNGDLIMEIAYDVLELARVRPCTHFSIAYTPAHLKAGKTNLRKGAKKFYNINRATFAPLSDVPSRKSIDINLMRYLKDYNNSADKEAKHAGITNIGKGEKYTEPMKFDYLY